MPRANPFSLGRGSRLKLPRELQDEAKIVEKMKLVDKALDAWEVYARGVIAEMDKVRETIGELKTTIARADREAPRGEQTTDAKARSELFEQCNRLLDVFTLR